MSKRVGKTTEPALLTDTELLNALKRTPSDELFRVIVSRHGKAVMASCRHVLSDPADVEDAFQATFVVLFRKLGSVDGATLSAWLYAVAHRVAVRALCDRQKRTIKENKAARQQFAVTVAGETSTRSPALPAMLPRQTPEREIPHNEISWRESVQILHEELDRLPEGCRRVLILCYLCGHSREEAALCLNWSVGAVKGMLERGRKMLAARLSRRGIAWSVGLLAVATGSSLQAMAPTPALMEMAVQAAKQQPVHGWIGWISGGSFMARMALHGFLGLAAAVGLVVWFAPAEGGGSNRAEIEEIAALHQKTVDSFKTMHLKLEVTGAKHTPYREELWKDGETHRWNTTDFLRAGGTQEALVKEGKQSVWVQAPAEGEFPPLFGGSILPSSKDTFIQPLNQCLLGCLDHAKNQTSSIPFRQLLNDPNAKPELSHVTESGREFAVVKMVDREYEREIWFSKSHNYLVSKLIQKWNVHESLKKNRNRSGPQPVLISPPKAPSEMTETSVFSVEEFKQVTPGVYFPARVTLHGKQGTEPNLNFYTKVEVRSVEINQPIPSSAFEFRFPPQLLVTDSTQKKVWRTDANGEIGVEARDEYGRILHLVDGTERWGPVSLETLIGLLMVIGLTVVGVVWFRRRRRRALSLARTPLAT